MTANDKHGGNLQHCATLIARTQQVRALFRPYLERYWIDPAAQRKAWNRNPTSLRSVRMGLRPTLQHHTGSAAPSRPHSSS